RRQGARVRRIPHAPRLHGPGGRVVRLERRGAREAQREGQGRARSKRDPRAGEERHLGQRPCGGARPMRRFRIAAAALLALAVGGAAVLVQAQQTDAAPAQPPPAPPPGMPKPVTMSERPNATGGEALYVEYCAMCHTPNGMGHGLLGRRVDEPDLEKRGNLPAAYVVMAARQGIGNMPPIPRGEVSDEDMVAIAAYLAAGPHEVTP